MQPVTSNQLTDIFETLSVPVLPSEETQAQFLKYSLKAGIFRTSILAICQLLDQQPLITNIPHILEQLAQDENYCNPHIFHMALLCLSEKTPALVTQSNIEALIPLKEQARDFALVLQELSKFKLKAAKFYLDDTFYHELLSQPRNFMILSDILKKIRILNKHLISIDLLTLILELSGERLTDFYYGLSNLCLSKNQLKAFFDEKTLALFLSEPQKGITSSLVLRALTESAELVTFENIKMLFDVGLNQYSSKAIELAWLELVQLNRELATQESFELIIQNHQHAKELLEVLSGLSFHDASPLSLRLWEFFWEGASHIRNTLELTTFLINHQLKLRPQILEALILTPYLPALCFEFESFVEEDLVRFLTVQDLEMLIEIDTHPSSYFFIIRCFYQSNPALLTPDVRQFIVENIDSWPDLGVIIRILSYQNSSLLLLEILAGFTTDAFQAQIFKDFFTIQNPHRRYILTRDILNEFWASSTPLILLQTLRQAPHLSSPIIQLNTAQNTHTASVHKSASESAARLFTRYHSKVASAETLNSCYDKIQRWGSRLDKESKKTVLECSAYTKTNPMRDAESGVTLKELIALGWLASSDSKTRLTDLRTARKRYFEGLDDMWHGYGPSKKICDHGMFNKEIESLVGVHPDAEQRMITKEQATAKLGIVVQEELRRFIKSHEQDIGIQLIAQLEEAGSICMVWDNIKPTVKARIFEEFGELFPQGQESSEFENLINWGLDANIALDSLKKELQSSLIIFSTGAPSQRTVKTDRQSAHRAR